MNSLLFSRFQYDEPSGTVCSETNWPIPLTLYAFLLHKTTRPELAGVMFTACTLLVILDSETELLYSVPAGRAIFRSLQNSTHSHARVVALEYTISRSWAPFPCWPARDMSTRARKQARGTSEKGQEMGSYNMYSTEYIKSIIKKGSHTILIAASLPKLTLVI